MKLTLYHATDLDNALRIRNLGFEVKKNDEHWLGNGVYFYLDLKLAEWWGTRPTKKFGSEITRKSIIRVKRVIPGRRILDLRKLSGYLKCTKMYTEFSKGTEGRIDQSVECDMAKLRCAFFDYVFELYEIDCIIACFTHEEQNYLNNLPVNTRGAFRLFNLPYTETQVCFNTDVINKKLQMDIIEVEHEKKKRY